MLSIKHLLSRINVTMNIIIYENKYMNQYEHLYFNIQTSIYLKYQLYIRIYKNLLYYTSANLHLLIN